MKTGLTISAVVHAALLLWGLISFAARPLEAKPNDALPVDIISDKQFSEMTKGVKNAPKDKRSPRRWSRRSASRSRSRTPRAKVTEKKELDAAKTEPPPPPAGAAGAEARAEAKPEKKEPPKIDPIAEALKKEEAKKKAEEQAAKAKAADSEKAQQQPQFDPTKIAALLDKREPTAAGAAGEQLSPTPSLGKSDGNAGAAVAERDRRAAQAPSANAGIRRPARPTAASSRSCMRVLFKPDGTVATPPQLVAAHARRRSARRWRKAPSARS